jgi:hypothetical protein
VLGSAGELARAEEQAEGLAAAGVMLEVGGPNALEEGDLREAGDRKATVDEAVVDDEVGDAEQGHADAGAEADVADHAGRAQAAVQDEGDGDGGVERREEVVALEAAGAPAVVGAVNPPEGVVPHAAVEERRPELHGGGHREGDRYPDRDRRHARTSPMIERPGALAGLSLELL